MTDIVERLRETETDVYTTPELATECREAADEIEYLRKRFGNLLCQLNAMALTVRLVLSGDR